MKVLYLQFNIACAALGTLYGDLAKIIIVTSWNPAFTWNDRNRSSLATGKEVGLAE